MLTEDQRRTLEGRLRLEREQALDAIGRHDADAQDLRDRAGELSLYRLHPADVATEAHEMEKEFLLASVEGRRLYEIDEALGRLIDDPDRFGRCAECGREIGWERLEVLPEATLCAEHARAADRDSGAAEAADPREAWRE